MAVENELNLGEPKIRSRRNRESLCISIATVIGLCTICSILIWGATNPVINNSVGGLEFVTHYDSGKYLIQVSILEPCGNDGFKKKVGWVGLTNIHERTELYTMEEKFKPYRYGCSR